MAKFTFQDNNDNTTTFWWSDKGSITFPAMREGEGIKMPNSTQNSRLLKKGENNQLVMSEVLPDGSINEIVTEDRIFQARVENLDVVDHFYVKLENDRIAENSASYSYNVEITVKDTEVQYKVKTVFEGKVIDSIEFLEKIEKDHIINLRLLDNEFVAYNYDGKVHLFHMFNGKYIAADKINFTIKTPEGVRYLVKDKYTFSKLVEFEKRASFNHHKEHNNDVIQSFIEALKHKKTQLDLGEVCNSIKAFQDILFPLRNENEAIIIGNYAFHIKGLKIVVSEFRDKKIGAEIQDRKKAMAVLRSREMPVEVYDIKQDHTVELSKSTHHFSLDLDVDKQGRIISKLICKEIGNQVCTEKVIEIEEKKYIKLFEKSNIIAYRIGTEVTLYEIGKDGVKEIRAPHKLTYEMKDGYRMIKPSNMIDRIFGQNSIADKSSVDDIEKIKVKHKITAKPEQTPPVPDPSITKKIEEYRIFWDKKNNAKYQIVDNNHLKEVITLEKQFDEIIEKLFDPKSRKQEVVALQEKFVKSIDENKTIHLKNYLTCLKELYSKTTEFVEANKASLDYKEFNTIKSESNNGVLSTRINEFLGFIVPLQNKENFVSKIKGGNGVERRLCDELGKAIFDIVNDKPYDDAPFALRKYVIAGSDQEKENMASKVMQAFSHISFDGEKGAKFKYLGRKNGAGLLETIKECLLSIFKSLIFRDNSFGKWLHSKTEIEIVDQDKFDKFLSDAVKLDPKAVEKGKSKLIEQLTKVAVAMENGASR